MCRDHNSNNVLGVSYCCFHNHNQQCLGNLLCYIPIHYHATHDLGKLLINCNILPILHWTYGEGYATIDWYCSEP